MRRYKILMDVTETYEVFVDAEDDGEAADNAYTLSGSEIMSGDRIPGSEIVEIQDILECPFDKED